jgi:MFS family permease
MVAHLSPGTASHIEDGNFHHLIRDIAWFGLGWAAVDRFRAVFAIRLGADEFTLNLIASMPALLLAIAATFALFWRERHSNSIKALLLPTFIFRLAFLLPAFTPLMPPNWRVPWLIFSAALPGIGQGIAAVLFMVCIQETVSQARMTALFSRRSVLFNVALAASAVLFGAWLEWIPFPQNYQAMFVFSFAMAMVSQWHCSRLIPIFNEAACQPVAGKPKRESSPWKSPAFRRVTLIMGITFIAFASVNALIPLRLVNTLNADEGFMAVFGLVELLAGAAASYFAPRLVNRIGHYGITVVGMILCGVAALMLGTINQLDLALLAAMLSGCGWMLVAMVAVPALYVKNVPVEEATRYSVSYHQVYGLVLFLGPFLSNGFVASGMSLATILLIGAALRIAAGLVVGGLWMREHGNTPREIAKAIAARLHL